MGTRRNSLIAGNTATRSEYDDVTLKHNTMADNKLSRELAELARAQKVISRDLAFEKKSLENNLRVSSQRRGSMPVLSSGRRLSLTISAPRVPQDEKTTNARGKSKPSAKLPSAKTFTGKTEIRDYSLQRKSETKRTLKDSKTLGTGENPKK